MHLETKSFKSSINDQMAFLFTTFSNCDLMFWQREEALAARQKFVSSEGDHIMLLNIFKAYKSVKGSKVNKLQHSMLDFWLIASYWVQ
jgi:hypothetical protein